MIDFGWVLLLVLLGSALGGMTRYAVSNRLATRFGAGYPWGTLAVNWTGSLAIGVFFGLTSSGPLFVAAPAWHQALTYGFLGGYTTYSTLMLDVLTLARGGEARRSAVYLGLTVAGGIALCYAGFAATGGRLL